MTLGTGYLDARADVIIKTPGIPASRVAKGGVETDVSFADFPEQLSARENHRRHRNEGQEHDRLHSSITFSNVRRYRPNWSAISDSRRWRDLTAAVPGNLLRSRVLEPPAGGDRDESSYRGVAEHCSGTSRLLPFRGIRLGEREHHTISGPGDFLVFNPDYPILKRLPSERRPLKLTPFSAANEDVRDLGEIPLPGKFNFQNVMAASRRLRLLWNHPRGNPSSDQRFQTADLTGWNRSEPYNGVTFYDDSIATVPDATLAALDALGHDVQTLILGGHERNLDFSELGAKPAANVRTSFSSLRPGSASGKRLSAFDEIHLCPTLFL